MDLDTLAMRMCGELGLDPDENVVCAVGDILTPAERLQRCQTKLPINQSWQASRWQLYRAKAAEHLAAAKVLQK
jgi:hypothetical protein